MPVIYKPDGFYDISELTDTLSKDFDNERNICDFIETNIDLFTKDCLNYELMSYEREYQIVKGTRKRIRGNRRIDFLIKTKCGKNIGIEVKHPRGTSELSNAVGQCLTYLTLMEIQGTFLDKIIIVSSKIDFVLPLVITKHNLPIEFFGFDKSKHVKFIGNGRT
jgi:hypothetical protein